METSIIIRTDSRGRERLEHESNVRYKLGKIIDRLERLERKVDNLLELLKKRDELWAWRSYYPEAKKPSELPSEDGY